MKDLKRTLFTVLFAVLLAAFTKESVYAYDITLTNKISGNNSNCKETTYFIPGGSDAIRITGDRENYENTKFFACNCGLYFQTGKALTLHDPYNDHGYTVWYGGGYYFTLANNKTATISVPDNHSVTICRIYDSSKVTDSQTVTYTKGKSTTKKSLAKCDVNSSDGISGITITKKTSITVYNSGKCTLLPKLSKTKLSLSVGASKTLTVKNTSKTVKWTSSDKKIATVTSAGKVKAIKSGTCTITAKVKNKTLTCKVTVTS